MGVAGAQGKDGVRVVGYQLRDGVGQGDLPLAVRFAERRRP